MPEAEKNHSSEVPDIGYYKPLPPENPFREFAIEEARANQMQALFMVVLLVAFIFWNRSLKKAEDPSCPTISWLVPGAYMQLLSDQSLLNKPEIIQDTRFLNLPIVEEGEALRVLALPECIDGVLLVPVLQELAQSTESQSGWVRAWSQSLLASEVPENGR